jgi:hypothetical protein
MELPEGVSEARFVKAVNAVAEILGKKFPFGCHEEDDIKQLVCQFSLEALAKGKYDPNLPLENYLYAHCFRRLLNLQRDEYCRNDPPCKQCHKEKPCPDSDGQCCEPYRRWRERNVSKMNLMKLGANDSASDRERSEDPDVTGKAERAEIFRLLDECLPLKVRRAFLKMKEGLPVLKQEREQVILECRRILLSDAASLGFRPTVLVDEEVDGLTEHFGGGQLSVAFVAQAEG